MQLKNESQSLLTADGSVSVSHRVGGAGTGGKGGWGPLPGPLGGPCGGRGRPSSIWCDCAFKFG